MDNDGSTNRGIITSTSLPLAELLTSSTMQEEEEGGEKKGRNLLGFLWPFGSKEEEEDKEKEDKEKTAGNVIFVCLLLVSYLIMI